MNIMGYKKENTHYECPRRRREREKGTENLFKGIMPKNSPNLGKDMAM